MNAKRICLWLGCLCALAVGAALLIAPPAPAAGAAGASTGPTLSDSSEVLQTLTYTRCSHTVTRRFTAPVELYGQGLAQVEALYPQWRVTELSAAAVRMEQQLEMYCPDHLVLLAGSDGRLCIFENRYGDALMLVEELETELPALSAAAREEAEAGIGFDTLQDLEQWLEGAES